MHVIKNLVSAAIAVLAAASVFAADLQATTLPLTAQLMLKRGEVSTTTRVEYCLRNLPELTEALVEAHANYSRAVTRAAQLLERDFPASTYTFEHLRIRKSMQGAAADDLKRAHSEGFDRVCPSIVIYMQRATGESLAKEIGNMMLRAQERL